MNRLTFLPGQFAHHNVDVGAMQPEWTSKTLNTGVIQNRLVAVHAHGQRFATTSRFLTSMASRFGFGPSIFTLFDPAEVFTRIVEKRANTSLRLTIHSPGDDKVPAALAVSDPAKSIIGPAELDGVLREVGCQDVYYDGDGIVFSTHRVEAEAPFRVCEDILSPLFTLKAPIDGYGHPAVFLMLLRQTCGNGAIAMAPAFKSEVSFGKGDSPESVLQRFLESFNNDEGFDALRERLEAAHTTAASVREVCGLRQALVQALNAREGDGEIAMFQPELFRAFLDLVGDVAVDYSVGALGYIPPARQSILNSRATIVDLVNFATEITTHCRYLLETPFPLHGWVGSTLSGHFDLEGAPLDSFTDVAVRRERRQFYLPDSLRRAEGKDHEGAYGVLDRAIDDEYNQDELAPGAGDWN